VWRQVVYIGLIVSALIVLRDRGPVGAAVAVLLATASMTLLMHILLERVTHVTWADIVRPQVPGLLCALTVGAAAAATAYGVRAAGSSSSWLLLMLQASAAVAVYVLFMLFAPLPDLRTLVAEVTHDLMPASVRRWPWVQTVLGWQAFADRSSRSSAA